MLEAVRSAPPPERAGALELLDGQLSGEGKNELLDALEGVAELRLCPSLDSAEVELGERH